MLKYRQPGRQRRGATLVESAIVYPLALFLILGIIIGGYGIFRYQEMAWLAREGARWAAVRGTQYASETGNPAATEADIRDYVREFYAAGDPSEVNVTVTWNTTNSPTTVTADNGDYVYNKVTVTVSAPFLPINLPIFGLEDATISSSSTMPMHY
jgi:Flp pilus assembly protein TadG